MNVTGRIIAIMEAKTFGNFTKREFVIETSEKYPQKILLEVTNDKVSVLDNVRSGDIVECGINLRGREWTSPQGETKYFNTIACWTMKLLDDERSNEAAINPNDLLEMNGNIAKPKDDDLPF